MSDNDPFAEGQEARDAGQPETANPYDPVTQELDHYTWNDGWAAADDDHHATHP